MTHRDRRKRKKRTRNGKSRQHVDAGKQRHENALQTWLRKTWWKVCDVWCWIRGDSR